MKGTRMPKVDFKGLGKVLDVVGKFGKEHLPEILTIAGLIGVTSAIISVADAVKKSEEEISKIEEAATAAMESEEPIEMPRKEKFKLCWKYFIPGTVLYITSVGLIIAGQKVSLARLAAVTGLLKLRSKDLEDLKNKIVEKDGEKKLNEYERAVEKDRICINPDTVIYNTRHGDTIFYEPLTGTLFYSDIWHVQRAIIHLIEAVRNENYYELSDFYADLDLPKCSCGQYFAFAYSLNSDLKLDHPEALFDYVPVDADNGDNRACIYLNILPRLDPSYQWEQEIRAKTPY